MRPDPANLEFDVVVAGSGSAGMTAAIVAALNGLSVVLVEKTSVFGGTTAWSGGGCWVPCNPLIEKVGLKDSREAAVAYADAVIGRFLRKDLYETFLDESPRMLDFMLKRTKVLFMPRTPAPDYQMTLPGALIGGRSLGSVPYDGRELGEHLPLLRPALSEFNAPWGMMMSPLDAMHALNAFKSRASFWYMTKLFARYFVDLLRYGRATRLTMGCALAGRLLRSAIDAGVTLWTKTEARRLVTADDGRVTGLIVARDGAEITLSARKGVVLACGGFSSSEEQRARFYPNPQFHTTLVAEGNTGDGQRMAAEVGATFQTENAHNGVWQVVSTHRRRDGSLQRVPHFFNDLPKPGCIAVNTKGERFGNEANLELAGAMNATGSVPAWLIADHAFMTKYGMGLVYPFGIRLSRFVREGYVKKGTSLRELAKAIGVDADGLERTVARSNEFARTGVDADFGKGGQPLDLAMGDPSHKPNPCLGPIATAPFYAVRIVPGDVASVRGLRVNRLAQPLDAQDRPIAGLHVCGLDMNSLWSGTGFANGAFHSQNMTFGYIIGCTLAGVSTRSAGTTQATGTPAAAPTNRAAA